MSVRAELIAIQQGKHHHSRSCVDVQDRDNLVRQRAASCLTLVGRKATGVRKVLTCGALPVLLDLLQDADVPTR